MSAPTPLPDYGASTDRHRGRVLNAVLVVVACAAQAVVLMSTFVMGLVWGGLTWVTALLLAGGAFVLIAWLAARRRKVVLLVPLLSAALAAGLFSAGYAFEVSTACSGEVREAVDPLAPPPGTTVEFAGEYANGCLARTSMALSDEAIVEHYEAEFARLGWQETPGQLEAVSGIAAVKDGVQLTVEIEDTEGSGEGMLETVVGDPGAASPCLVNRVGNDEAMSREPTGQVEPGQWMMFVSADELPASAVVRDGGGAVILDQQAHARPEDNDDLIESQDAMGGLMTLLLEEGVHEVECRPRDGAAVVVPLRVAWDEAGDDQTTKRVVLRVYESRQPGA